LARETARAARAGTLTLISSPALLAELAEVMNRPKFQAILVRSNTDSEQTLGELRGGGRDYRSAAAAGTG